MTLGEYIKQYRDEHGLSLRDMEERTGISKQHLANLEKGINNDGNPVSPTMKIVELIAKGTGITPLDLCRIIYDEKVNVNPDVQTLLDLLPHLSPELQSQVRELALSLIEQRQSPDKA